MDSFNTKGAVFYIRMPDSAFGAGQKNGGIDATVYYLVALSGQFSNHFLEDLRKLAISDDDLYC
jgi:hypothetical protein